jgi:Na+/phosphate symporter
MTLIDMKTEITIKDQIIAVSVAKIGHAPSTEYWQTLNAAAETLKEVDYSDKTPDQMEEINAADLREMAHYYGGWDKLLKIIDNIKERDQEAAYDRRMEDYDRISEGERQESQYRIQRYLK